MTPLRLVSIVHPSRAEPIAFRRFGLLADIEATVLTPTEATASTPPSGVRRVSVQTRGRGTAARFPSLPTALSLLEPDVVHLQADPDTRLAAQVVGLCGGQRRFGLVLETEADGQNAGRWSPLASIRSRRVLGNTGALVARSAGALTFMRRLGFQGVGVVAGCGLEPVVIPSTDEARRMLGIRPDAALVLAWGGSTDMRGGIVDMFEAIATSETDVVVIVEAAGKLKQDLTDRADALDILHLLRFVAPTVHPGSFGNPAGLARQPAMAGAADALLLATLRGKSDRLLALENVAFAQTHGIPVIYPQQSELAEIIGPGGWSVPPGDPALMARLIRVLSEKESLITDAAIIAADHAASRHSAEAATADLWRAIQAAASGRTSIRSGLEARGEGRFRLNFKREPSRT